MSMSIYAMGYNNSSVQNKENAARSSTQKTNEEEVKMAELQQGIGTTRLTKDDIRQDGTVSVVQRMQGTESYRRIQAGETAQQFSEELTEERSYAEMTRMDRTEISEEGRIANAKMRKQTEKMGAAQNTENKIQEPDSDNTENEVKNLSEYTDAELEQMYYKGEITLQEYEDETGKAID